jgi:hypothetical protein
MIMIFRGLAKLWMKSLTERVTLRRLPWARPTANFSVTSTVRLITETEKPLLLC